MEIVYILYIIFFIIFITMRMKINQKTKNNINLLNAQIKELEQVNKRFIELEKKHNELKFTNNKLNTKIIILENRKLLPPS